MKPRPTNQSATLPRDEPVPTWVILSIGASCVGLPLWLGWAAMQALHWVSRL